MSTRSLAPINQDRDRLRSKVHDLTAEAEAFAEKHKDDWSEPGIQERARRLQTGIGNAKHDLELLDDEAREHIRALADDPRHTEEGSYSGAGGYATRAAPTGTTAGFRSQALRSVEHLTRSGILGAEGADRLDGIIRDDERDPMALGARYLSAVSNEHYRAAFWKVLRSGPEAALLDMTAQEADAVRTVRRVDQERGYAERALSLTGSAGGFAVPVDLDPTIIPTSDGAINPFRAVATVKTIAVDTWRGVSSGAITAAYAAEATETTDNSPTLAQPEISTEKAQAFIPFSIEVGMDWQAIREELGGLLADSKDSLEATKFTSGTGTNEPFGLLVGITNNVNATTGQTVDAEDIYRLEQALAPRYQPRARYMASGTIVNTIYRLVGGGSTEPALVSEDRTRLLGKPLVINSAMGTTTATGVEFLVYGDFSRFVIVDRIGLAIELIPHLFGTNHRPTGQRGLYAFWRNGSKVVDANGFQALIGIA